VFRANLAALVSAGVRQVILVVGFRSEKIRDRLGRGEVVGAELKYVKQKPRREPRTLSNM